MKHKLQKQKENVYLLNVHSQFVSVPGWCIQGVLEKTLVPTMQPAGARNIRNDTSGLGKQLHQNPAPRPKQTQDIDTTMATFMIQYQPTPPKQPLILEQPNQYT